MIDKKTTDFIDSAVKNEQIAAIEKHGHFHSMHEAYAVLLEEVEEVKEMHEAFDGVQEMQMRLLWDNVRQDYENYCDTRLGEIKAAALDLAYECVQVAAMCDKWGLLLEKGAAAYDERTPEN